MVSFYALTALILVKGTVSTHRIGEWMGPTVDLDACQLRENKVIQNFI
jgi:hypothetical protein